MPKSKVGKVEALNTNLNVVLDKDTINTIVRGVIGRNGQKLIDPGGTVRFGSGHCCVDASVGSSAIGPVSTVGSSVSHHPEPPGGGMQRFTRSVKKAKTKIAGSVKTGKSVKVAVKLPRSIKVR